jgi:hypothetical protein
MIALPHRVPNRDPRACSFCGVIFVASTSANKKKPRYNLKLPIAHNTMCKSISEPHRRKIAVSDVEGRRDELVVVLLRFVAEERTGYTIRDPQWAAAAEDINGSGYLLGFGRPRSNLQGKQKQCLTSLNKVA